MSHESNNTRNTYNARHGEAALSKSRLASSEIEKVLNWIKNQKNFLVFIGNPGVGKTDFCHAVINYLRDMKYRGSYRYWNERQFLQRIRGEIEQKGDFLEKAKYLLDDDFIVFDDLGSSNHTDWRKDVLFEILDYRYEVMKPTIFTSNLTEQEVVNQFGQRFHSRMFAKENTFIKTDSPDLRLNGL